MSLLGGFHWYLVSKAHANKHPTMYRTVPTTKKDPIQIVSSAELKKLRSNPTYFLFECSLFCFPMLVLLKLFFVILMREGKYMHEFNLLSLTKNMFYDFVTTLRCWVMCKHFLNTKVQLLFFNSCLANGFTLVSSN